MSDVQAILQMIETVDPADTAKLDEIDARVHCFLKGKDYERHFTGKFFGLSTKAWGDDEVFTNIVKYTRSRDALKAIRPEGWRFNVWHEYDGSFNYAASRETPAKEILRHSMKTEELTELHAIIQAIDYERSK